MRYVHMSEGGFPVVYSLGLWSRFSRVVKSYSDPKKNHWLVG